MLKFIGFTVVNWFVAAMSSGLFAGVFAAGSGRYEAGRFIAVGMFLITFLVLMMYRRR